MHVNNPMHTFSMLLQIEAMVHEVAAGSDIVPIRLGSIRGQILARTVICQPERLDSGLNGQILA